MKMKPTTQTKHQNMRKIWMLLERSPESSQANKLSYQKYLLRVHQTGNHKGQSSTFDAKGCTC
jgi:hypothetical protein